MTYPNLGYIKILCVVLFISTCLTIPLSNADNTDNTNDASLEINLEQLLFTAQRYMSTDIKKAQTYADKAYQLAMTLSHKEHRVRALLLSL